MKLSLERYKDLSILTVLGPVNLENFAVLRAGIKKLFKEGKNKIVLELPEASHFAPEILRELTVLNLLASELSGQIVLAGIEPLIRAKIESFAKPPIIRCFMDRESALRYFHPLAKAEGEEAPKPATSSEAPTAASAPAGETSAPPPSGQTAPDPKSLKAEIRGREIGDLGAARKRISDLESENSHLREQLEGLVLKRRESPDAKASQEKIDLLQKQIDELVTQLNAKDAKK